MEDDEDDRMENIEHLPKWALSLLIRSKPDGMQIPKSILANHVTPFLVHRRHSGWDVMQMFLVLVKMGSCTWSLNSCEKHDTIITMFRHDFEYHVSVTCSWPHFSETKLKNELSLVWCPDSLKRLRFVHHPTTNWHMADQWDCSFTIPATFSDQLITPILRAFLISVMGQKDEFRFVADFTSPLNTTEIAWPLTNALELLNCANQRKLNLSSVQGFLRSTRELPALENIQVSSDTFKVLLKNLNALNPYRETTLQVVSTTDLSVAQTRDLYAMYQSRRDVVRKITVSTQYVTFTPVRNPRNLFPFTSHVLNHVKADDNAVMSGKFKIYFKGLAPPDPALEGKKVKHTPIFAEVARLMGFASSKAFSESIRVLTPPVVAPKPDILPALDAPGPFIDLFQPD